MTSHADDMLPRLPLTPPPSSESAPLAERSSSTGRGYRPWDTEEFDESLDKTWRRRRGLYGWVTTTNHKDIGMRFVVTAFIFFGFAGVLALLVRTQLAIPNNTFLGPDQYNHFSRRTAAR